MNESEMSKATTAELRLGAAQYFYTQYLKHCGPPLDSYFLMVNYFDAFLFALTSIEEMIDQHSKKALRANQTFRFLKALRNITTHHSVLAAAVGNAKFPRPFSRDLSV